MLLLVTTNVTVWPLSSDGPGLIAVAQPLTDWAPASSTSVWLAPLTKLGGSLTPVTLIVKVWTALVSSPPLAIPPLSLMETLTVAEPTWLAAGVNVSVPLELTAGSVENRPVLSLVTMNDTVWPDSLDGPSLIDDRPARDRPGAGVLGHGLVRALGEARGVVHLRDRDREGLRRAVVGRPATIVVGMEGDRRRSI